MTRARNFMLALLLLDVASMLAVYNGVLRLRGLNLWDQFLVLPLLGPIFALVLAFFLIDAYSSRTDMLSLDYASQHAIAVFSAMIVTVLATFVVIPPGYELQSSRLVIMLTYLILAPITLVYRRLAYMRTLRSRGALSLVFFGDSSSCQAFKQECEATSTTQPVVFVTSDTRPGAPASLKARQHPFEEVLDNIQAGKLAVEAIVLRESSRELPPEISRRLVQLFFTGVPTYTLELFHQIYWRKIPLYRLNQTWLFQEGFQIAREPVFARLKRITDIALAGLGLILAAPLILLAALAVWLEDRGPTFFCQNRVGKNHTIFRIYKVRTMRSSPATEPGSLYTQSGDTRVTRTGRFLRATRLDEFPQLWNVLRGDMSLIGPRAEWDRLVENYEREIPCYHFRHLVKPGITGWAQVNYPYGANLEDTLRKLEYDLYYIRHFSFTMDASIVLKTIHIVLFGKGR